MREYIRHPGAAMMLAFIDERTILLERQFRYPLRRHFIELPAGKIDAGEDPLATAQRELREECGYEAASWRHLATLHPCIGYADERIELYLARELTHVGHALDEDEFLEVIPVDVAEALEWVRTGRITEPKAILRAACGRISCVRGEWVDVAADTRRQSDSIDAALDDVRRRAARSRASAADRWHRVLDRHGLR